MELLTFQTVHTPEAVEQVTALAEEIWTEHYAAILSVEQIRYMVDKYQSAPAIEEQLTDKLPLLSGDSGRKSCRLRGNPAGGRPPFSQQAVSPPQRPRPGLCPPDSGLSYRLLRWSWIALHLADGKSPQYRLHCRL